MEDFLEENKDALVQEIGESIGIISTIIEEAISKEPSRNSLDELKNSFIGLSYKTGYLSAIFNQYYILLNKKVNKESKKPVGFSSLL